MEELRIGWLLLGGLIGVVVGFLLRTGFEYWWELRNNRKEAR
jgi:hypothetical protein